MQIAQTSTSKGPSALSLGGGVGLSLREKVPESSDDGLSLSDCAGEANSLEGFRDLAKAYEKRCLSRHLHLRVRARNSKAQAHDICAAFQAVPSFDEGFFVQEFRGGIPFQNPQEIRRCRQSSGWMNGTVLINLVEPVKHGEVTIPSLVRLVLCDECPGIFTNEIEGLRFAEEGRIATDWKSNQTRIFISRSTSDMLYSLPINKVVKCGSQVMCNLSNNDGEDKRWRLLGFDPYAMATGLSIFFHANGIGFRRERFAPFLIEEATQLFGPPCLLPTAF